MSTSSENKIPYSPDVAFRRLKTEDKEVLLLVQLMLTEVQKSNEEGVRQLLVELNRISATQRAQEWFMNLHVLFVSSGATYLYLTSLELKSQMLEVSTNLAANSGEIISDLFSGLKYELVGLGKPFEWKDDWLEAKEAADVEKKKREGAAKK